LILLFHTVLCFALNDVLPDYLTEAMNFFSVIFCQAFLDKFVVVACRILCLEVVLFAFCIHVHAMYRADHAAVATCLFVCHTSLFC